MTFDSLYYKFISSIKFLIQDKIVKKLTSSDREEQECGKKLADEILKKNIQKEIYEDGEVKIKTNRSVINKYPSEEDDPSNDPNKMSRGKLLFVYILYYCLIYVVKLMQFI